jgi:hypothetical protein
MTKNKTGNTINQMLSKARTRFQWLQKLQKNVSPLLNKLSDFELARNVYDPPKVANTLTLTYCGEETPEAVLKARSRFEKVFGTINDDNTVVVKCGRITMTITVVTPTVTLKKAA